MSTTLALETDVMTSYATDSISNLFEPDVLLPSQYHSAKASGIDGGERRLMAALLSDGIEAYLSQYASAAVVTKRQAAGYIDARDWIHTRDTSYIFSFDVVCGCLGVDPDYLRLGLARYVESMLCDATDEKSTWKKIRRPRKS